MVSNLGSQMEDAQKKVDSFKEQVAALERLVAENEVTFKGIECSITAVIDGRETRLRFGPGGACIIAANNNSYHHKSNVHESYKDYLAKQLRMKQKGRAHKKTAKELIRLFDALSAKCAPTTHYKANMRLGVLGQCDEGSRPVKGCIDGKTWWRIYYNDGKELVAIAHDHVTNKFRYSDWRNRAGWVTPTTFLKKFSNHKTTVRHFNAIIADPEFMKEVEDEQTE